MRSARFARVAGGAEVGQLAFSKSAVSSRAKLFAAQQAIMVCVYDRLAKYNNDFMFAALRCAADRVVYPDAPLSRRTLTNWKAYSAARDAADRTMSPETRRALYQESGYGSYSLNRVVIHALDFANMHNKFIRSGV